MPEIGQNLSHYSTVVKIGEGGMGEVFRAKDQRLGIEIFGSSIFRSILNYRPEASFTEPVNRQ